MNSVIENIQYQNSCGYIATKAVFLQYLAGKDWFKVDIIQDTVIIALKMIEDGNKILGKPPGKTYDLEASEIVILLGEYLEISGNKRGTVHKIIDIAPMPFDVFIPKISELIEKSHRGTGTNGTKYFIVNLDTFGNPGWHWILVTVSVGNKKK